MARLERQRQGLTDIALIAVLRDRANHIRTQLYQTLLEEVDRHARTPEPTNAPAVAGEMPQSVIVAPTYVNVTKLAQNLGKPYLASEADVDTYIETLRTALKSAIKAGNRIIE